MHEPRDRRCGQPDRWTDDGHRQYRYQQWGPPTNPLAQSVDLDNPIDYMLIHLRRVEGWPTQRWCGASPI